MKKLNKEFEKVKANGFELKFKYPTEEEREHLNIVNRDMTADEKKRVKKGKSDLGELLKDLESGKIYLEDLGAEQVKKLRALIDRESKK